MRRVLLAFVLSLTVVMPVLAAEPLQPILQMELEKESAIPGQPIVLRITVLVPTWLLTPPAFPSFEVPNVMVRLPSRASGPTSQRVGGETWSGVTRAYRLYPMTVGRFQIAPQPVTVTFAGPKTREPKTLKLRTDEIAFEGAAPEGAEALDPFIAAEALTLEQTIDGDPSNLEPGGAVTRTVTARTTATSPIFLPRLIQPLSETGIASYPKEPVVTETEDRGTISGERVESVTYVAEAGGRYAAPPITVRWFNLGTNRVETAEVSGFEIVSRGPLPEPPSTFNWRAAIPWIIAGIVFAALLGAAARRFWPRIAMGIRRRREAHLSSEAHAFDQATAALRARKFGDAVSAVALWSSRLPPMHDIEDTRLSEALARLGDARYGRVREIPSSDLWSEANRAVRAARRARLAPSSAAQAGHALPPLNPRVTS